MSFNYTLQRPHMTMKSEYQTGAELRFHENVARRFPLKDLVPALAQPSLKTPPKSSSHNLELVIINYFALSYPSKADPWDKKI